jgi:hypothetical protein
MEFAAPLLKFRINSTVSIVHEGQLYIKALYNVTAVHEGSRKRDSCK